MLFIVKKWNELGDRIVRAAECITNEILASTWREAEFRLDVCGSTNGAHIEMELCEVQCLKTYQLLQYIVYLRYIMFYFNAIYFRSLICCLTPWCCRVIGLCIKYLIWV
jgi:hypothetical protein